MFVASGAVAIGVGLCVIRRQPGVALALFGAVVGGVGGFLIENADGPSEVPSRRR
jgi:hypothetical protein